MIARWWLRVWPFLVFGAGCGTTGGANDSVTPGDTSDGAGPLAHCAGGPGTFSSLSLDVGGETRAYYLHVPAAYRCEEPWPLLVDFHGTSIGPLPEESYALAEAKALADLRGFILVRPRSLSSEEGGDQVYRWDQNPGDVAKNVAFTDALVGDLALRYNLDPQRLYSFGFSTGTNMAAQLIGDTKWAFSGFGIVGGGMWDDPGLPDLEHRAMRVYTVTGYRDYMFEYKRDLDALLDAKGLPGELRKNRETDSGHDLYGWHYEEMWRWIDGDKALGGGQLTALWKPEAFGWKESLLSLSRNPDGDLIATGSGGAFFKRDHTTSTWSRSGDVPGAPSTYFTGLCFLPSGAGIAVGGTVVARTMDGGASFGKGPLVPEFQGDYFGASYLNAVACSESGRITGGGYWTGVESSDAGDTWHGAGMDNGGSPAQVAAMASRAQTVISVGYYSYIGRSNAGGPFQERDHPGVSEWWNGVTAGPNGHFWVVGERGEILHSSDDGLHWERQTTPRLDDLYAVGFYDEHTGLAVGLHGAALLTRDGGESWVDTSTGLDSFLGAVAFLDAKTALVVGEGGAVLRLSL